MIAVLPRARPDRIEIAAGRGEEDRLAEGLDPDRVTVVPNAVDPRLAELLAATPHAIEVGLTLVRRLTEDHAGTVTAASAGTGHGSRFTLTLPLASAPA